jgi:hypothetical protein
MSEEPAQALVHRLVWAKHGAAIRAHPDVERDFRRSFDRMLLYRALRDGRWCRGARYGLRATRTTPDTGSLVLFGLGLSGPVGFRVAATLRRRLVDRRADFDHPDWATV